MILLLVMKIPTGNGGFVKKIRFGVANGVLTIAEAYGRIIGIIGSFTVVLTAGCSMLNGRSTCVAQIWNIMTSIVNVAFSTRNSQVASSKKYVVGDTVRVNLVLFAALIMPQFDVIFLDESNVSGDARRYFNPGATSMGIFVIRISILGIMHQRCSNLSKFYWHQEIVGT